MGIKLPENIIQKYKNNTKKKTLTDKEINSLRKLISLKKTESELKREGSRDYAWMDFISNEKNHSIVIKIVDDWLDYVADVSWEMRLEIVKSEIDAFEELSEIVNDYRELKVLSKNITSEIELELETSSSYKNSIPRILEKIDNELVELRALLINLENIIGSECYNRRSWSSHGEPKAFSYPVKVNPYSSRDAPFYSYLDLNCGHYKFGANEFRIYKGIAKAIKFLKYYHNFDIEKHNRFVDKKYNDEIPFPIHQSCIKIANSKKEQY